MRIPAGAYDALGRVIETLLNSMSSGKTADGKDLARHFMEIRKELANAIDAIEKEQAHIREVAERSEKTAADLRTEVHNSDRAFAALSSKFHMWMYISGAIHAFSLAVIIYFLARR
jgi:septal ring factor EnvC (AmiA/AmiB activator)